MAAANSTCPKSTNWRELYRAAILELDPAKLPVRIPTLLSPTSSYVGGINSTHVFALAPSPWSKLNRFRLCSPSILS